MLFTNSLTISIPYRKLLGEEPQFAFCRHLEERSRNTVENALNCREILEGFDCDVEGDSYDGDEDEDGDGDGAASRKSTCVYLVTNEFHTPRARLIFESVLLPSLPSDSDHDNDSDDDSESDSDSEIYINSNNDSDNDNDSDSDSDSDKRSSMSSSNSSGSAKYYEIKNADKLYSLVCCPAPSGLPRDVYRPVHLRPTDAKLATV
jgi:hypothetical protein